MRGFAWHKTGSAPAPGWASKKSASLSSDFKPSTQDPNTAALLKTFNDTLWNDLDNAGIFDMVSKSFYPLARSGRPAEVQLEAWSAPPPNAAMLAFGNFNVAGNDLLVHGWLYDVKNAASPQVLGKQYRESHRENARA